jgi:hypothetical protein
MRNLSRTDRGRLLEKTDDISDVSCRLWCTLNARARGKSGYLRGSAHFWLTRPIKDPATSLSCNLHINDVSETAAPCTSARHSLHGPHTFPCYICDDTSMLRRPAHTPFELCKMEMQLASLGWRHRGFLDRSSQHSKTRKVPVLHANESGRSSRV